MLKKDTIKNFPRTSGVYLFRNKSGRVLYVGKAISLKSRVENYFAHTEKDYKASGLLASSDSIKYLETKSELESLLLEARLIKQYRPKFNVQLKDDKRYIYAAISKGKYPRVYLSRQPEREKLLTWFGPFPTGSSAKEVLRIIRRIFPFRSCENLPKKPCLYRHIGLCLAVCVEDNPNYGNEIKAVKNFLNGNIGKLKRSLKKKMNEFSANMEFEKAGEIKNQLDKIDQAFDNYRQTRSDEAIIKMEKIRRFISQWQGFEPFIVQRLEAYDVANLGKSAVVGSMVVFANGEPDTSLYRQFKIRDAKWDDPKCINEIINRRLNHQEWDFPQIILVDGGKTQVAGAFKALADKDLVGKIGLLGLVKGKEKLIIPVLSAGKGKIEKWKVIRLKPNSLVLKTFQHARDEAHRFAQRYHRKLVVKKMMGGAN